MLCPQAYVIFPYVLKMVLNSNTIIIIIVIIVIIVI